MLATRSGWIGKIEVTEVRFDPKRVRFRELLQVGSRNDCGSHVFPTTESQRKITKEFAGVVDAGAPTKIRLEGLKHYLSRTSAKFMPLTEWQSTRWNAALARKTPFEPTDWLSSTQRRIWKAIQSNPDAGWKPAIGLPLTQTWPTALKSLAAR